MIVFPRSLLILVSLLTIVLVLAAPGPARIAAQQEQDAALRADRLGITFINSIDTPNSEERYQRALELGAGWTRWPLYWDRVETEAGSFDWEPYDALVEADIEHGLRANVILLGVPEFYRSETSIEGLHEPIFADGSDTPREGKAINRNNPWARFVYEAVRRYQPGGLLAWVNNWEDGQGVTVWEVWNEPDFSSFWNGGVYDYTRMLKVAYLVIHHVDPDATVMLGGLLYPTQDNWLARVLGLIIDDPFHAQHNWYMDAVAVHSYGNAWRSGWLTLYVRQTLVAYELDRPIWLNESGVAAWDDYPGPTWLADAPAERSTRATAEQQAAFFIQSTAYAWAEGARVVFYHQLFDDCGDQAPGTNPAPGDIGQFGDAFGIFRNPRGGVCFSQHPQPGSPRPVARAFRLMAEIFSVPFSRRGVVEEFENGAVSVTFLRPASGERVVVLWNTTTDPVELALPAHAERAALHLLHGWRTLRPTGDSYALRLPPALAPAHRSFAPGGAVDIGGMPVILVEQLPPGAAQTLAARTFAVVPAAEPDATPTPRIYLSDADVDALVAASPTGVAFTSLNISRLRTLPNTETSRVVGTIPPGQSAHVVARTEDSGWLQIDYAGQTVWVAAFLGDIHGDLTTVPVAAAADITGS